MADPVFKKDKVYQRFNLKEMFGVDFSNKPELRSAIGSAIVERIVERTENGAGIGGRPFSFGKYSDEYSKTIEFKAHGKNQHEVNMSLTGDMLGLMQVIGETTNTVSVGWGDATQNAKAYNHNTGDTVPKRPFFGLSASEIREIVKEFKPAVREAAESGRASEPDSNTQKLSEILKDLRSEEE